MTAPSVRSPESPTLDALLGELATQRRAHASVLAAPLPAELLDQLTADGLEGLRARSTVSWEHGNSATRIFGIGVAARFSGSRDGSLPAESVSFARLTIDAQDGISEAARPRLFGGFEFDPLQTSRNPRWGPMGAWQFILPRVVISWGPDGVEGTVCVATGHGASAAAPSPATADMGAGLDTDGWSRAVAAARDEIRANCYAKTVLARQRHVPLGSNWDAARTLTALAERYPGCFVFRFDAVGATWIGASPERLVSLNGGEARADSLAGSCRRGPTPDEDADLGRQLLNDPKEREEHAFVVQAITESLAPHTRFLEHPADPVVMKLANIQHLHTPVIAQVRDGVTILDLVRAMHPTPAVGGWPRAEALDAIRRLEHMDRGWYGAPVGWLDFNGGGEFAVGLRTALIAGGEATLFAGAGIVADSEPEREVAEIALKFKPMEDALRAGGAWT